jgi:hypothetical protein
MPPASSIGSFRRYNREIRYDGQKLPILPAGRSSLLRVPLQDWLLSWAGAAGYHARSSGRHLSAS